jgi:hypothetical protein
MQHAASAAQILPFPPFQPMNFHANSENSSQIRR